MLAELERREPESAAFIRPQRQWADISVRFAPVAGHVEPRGTPLSAEILLRPTIQHPELAHVLTDDDRRTVHLKLIRDSDGRPVDALHIHGYAPREDSRIVEKAIWEQLSFDHGTALPDTLGEYAARQAERGPGHRAAAAAVAPAGGPGVRPAAARISSGTARPWVPFLTWAADAQSPDGPGTRPDGDHR